MKDFLKYGTFALATVLLIASGTFAQVIVPSPFVSSYDGWTDTFDGIFPETAPSMRVRQPQWGVLLADGLLMENSDGFISGDDDGTGGGTYVPGTFKAFNLINTTDSGAAAVSTYTLSGTFSAFDNDGMGLIFGYQDENNFFRLTTRPDTSGSVGATVGLSLQKVVNGVYTQIGADSSISTPRDGTDYTLGVTVSEFLEAYTIDVTYGGAPTAIAGISGADLSPGQYGVFSWGQRSAGWGGEYRDITFASTGVNVTHTFTDTAGVSWREYDMTNSDGNSFTYPNPTDFRLDFRDGTIRQCCNNFEWATTTAPNTDFLSPNVVVDDPNSSTWTDYEMQVRLANEDDDGIGLLVRVEDEDSFYRINFCNQAISTDHKRPPQGMSIQKYLDGTWTELYRDNQTTPLFVYSKKIVDSETGEVTDAVPFDLKVTVEGNGITVQVIDDPDGAATVINYPTVYDTTDPILSGTVGFAAWGSGHAEWESIYSGYGGDVNAPLLVELDDDIPGDANHDKKVDASDATILAGNWQAGNATWEMGDFNGDGWVDASDATILAGNWQTGTGATTVPEPSMIVLLLLGAIALFLRKVK